MTVHNVMDRVSQRTRQASNQKGASSWLGLLFNPEDEGILSSIKPLVNSIRLHGIISQKVVLL
jgi:hypothetical protein